MKMEIKCLWGLFAKLSPLQEAIWVEHKFIGLAGVLTEAAGVK
jgi:hypothetical protein